MNKLPFYLQVAIFLICFAPLAIYMVGGLETEDGRTLLIIVLIGGVISTMRALYNKNKLLKRMKIREEEED